jgi:hypothetical protein
MTRVDMVAVDDIPARKQEPAQPPPEPPQRTIETKPVSDKAPSEPAFGGRLGRRK